jgi:hypothetical protein
MLWLLVHLCHPLLRKNIFSFNHVHMLARDNILIANYLFGSWLSDFLFLISQFLWLYFDILTSITVGIYILCSARKSLVMNHVVFSIPKYCLKSLFGFQYLWNHLLRKLDRRLQKLLEVCYGVVFYFLKI